MANERSDERLGTAPIGRLMLSMGLPGLVAQLINILYNLVDRMYLGHIEGVGAMALTGVGLTLPILQIISAFAALVGMGGAPLAAIELGKGNRERAKTILGNALTVLLLLSAALTVLFLVIRRPFLFLIGASEATYPYADQYIVIYLCGTVFVQLALGLNPYITAQGCSRTAMLSILIGAVLNIVLDPLFIFTFGLGVRGAALATVISQAASALWILLFLMRKDTALPIRLPALRPNPGIIASTMALGVAPFIMQSTESLITVVLSSGLARYGGDLYVGSLTILQAVMQFISVPMHGFAGSVAPIMSYNHGAGRTDRVRAVFFRLLATCMGFNGLLALSAMLFPAFYARLFTSDAALIALVGRVMPVFLAGMLVFGAQAAIQNTFMALGQAKRSLFVALLRKVILLAPLAAILPALTQNVMSIYWAEPVSDLLSVSLCATLFILYVKKTNFGERKG